MRRVTAGAKAVFRGAHILEQKKTPVDVFCFAYIKSRNCLLRLGWRNFFKALASI